VGAVLDRWLAAQTLRQVPDGRLVRTLPLGRFDGRPTPPFDTLLGAGLDARQFTDLSRLQPDDLQTPTARFYVRTAHPPSLPRADAWTIRCGGPTGAEQLLALGDLRREARDMGLRVMECAGNADPANFGLLSAAAWSGVPVTAVLDRLHPQATTGRILITGLDADRSSVTSNAGASWVFTRDELERTGAFLALAMNGAPLTSDHGAPVRLVVPNYYGCACLKWITRIDWVDDAAPATSQMREFSTRTHQRGVPTLARDYEPPVIDLAAAPVRVEQWEVVRPAGVRFVHRVVGVRWGGTVRRAPLTIRFRHTEPFVPVGDIPEVADPAAWSLWSHEWMPEAPGRYQIALSVSDPAIRARRLALYYYIREVEIDRV